MTSPPVASLGDVDARLRLRGLPLILMYHAVADVTEDPHKLAVSPDRFVAQMAWLARRGLRGVGVGALADAVGAGQHRGLVGITFDDGYVSVLSAALPVLRRHGFSATVFVIADLLGRANEWDSGPVWPLLDGAGVTELASAGIEIGAHGATHVRLAGLPPAELAAEVTGSRVALCALTGTPVLGFAYPYGSIDDAARRAVHDAGYAYGCAVTAPPGQLTMTALPRIYIGQADGPARMAAKQRLFRSHIALRGARQ